MKFYISEWVGDVDSVNLGRFGLWQNCHKDDLIEKCYGNLYGILEMESLPQQVCLLIYKYIIQPSILLQNKNI